MTSVRALLLVTVAVLGLGAAGCTSVSRAPDGPSSEAIEAGEDSALGRLGLAALSTVALGHSALHLLASGQDAFAARLTLAEHAERGLDLQYYIFRPDDSGTALLAALQSAGDRGVRVRLLLDDWGARPDDKALARLATHPHIEVRLFNPLMHPASPLLSLLTDFERTHLRMHNKLMVADGRAAIVGGRNIGDEYFSRRRELEFGDVDVLAFGPVVPQFSAAFDRYWNDALSVAVRADPAPSEATARAGATDADRPVGTPTAPWAARLFDGSLQRFGGTASAVQDLPGKLDPDRPADATRLGRDIALLMGDVQHELLIVSPYFVPGRGGVDQLRALAQRGVRVTVVTNTLAANDVPAVHGGYARWRHALLEAGVSLYEVRADATPRASAGRSGSSRLSLHAKLLVVDRSTAFVGSMNIDPRSQRLNTENGVVITSPALATALADGVQQALVDDAWRVNAVDGRLRWSGRQGGAEQTLNHEPGASWWLRLKARVLSWLPIEELL